MLMDTVWVLPVDCNNPGLYRPALRAQMPSACMRRRFPGGAFLDPCVEQHKPDGRHSQNAGEHDREEDTVSKTKLAGSGSPSARR